jgi:hypothetical protein
MEFKTNEPVCLSFDSLQLLKKEIRRRQIYSTVMANAFPRRTTLDVKERKKKTTCWYGHCETDEFFTYGTALLSKMLTETNVFPPS